MSTRTIIRASEQTFRNERGAALIVGLVLLLALTVLGVSAMNMAQLELRMAGNNQAQQLAFQAAETGIDLGMSGPVSTSAPYVPPTAVLGDGSYEVDITVRCVGTTRVPDGAYSANLSARAIHFEISAEGRHTVRNAVSRHAQSVYIVGPDPGNPNFNPAVSPGEC